MLHFVICDDNRNTLDRIITTMKTIFENHDIDATVSYATTSASKILKYVKSNRIDVILLDIDLSSEISGIDIAREIRNINKNAYIIFLTGHFEYSMLAYKVKTFDFLVKPISYINLEETILRLCEDIYGNKSLFVQLGNTNNLYRADDILFIEKDKAKATVHATTSSFQIYGTIDQIKSCLPGYFVRCNKSIIINIQKITHINSKNRTICIGDDEIVFSNRYINDERKLMFNERVVN